MGLNKVNTQVHFYTFQDIEIEIIYVIINHSFYIAAYQAT